MYSSYFPKTYIWNVARSASASAPKLRVLILLILINYLIYLRARASTYYMLKTYTAHTSLPCPFNFGADALKSFGHSSLRSVAQNFLPPFL